MDLKQKHMGKMAPYKVKMRKKLEKNKAKPQSIQKV